MKKSGTSKKHEEVILLVLAAGSSSRMGQSKQLLLVDGHPLLRKIVNTALESKLGRVVVVLGSNSEEHKKIIEDLSVENFVHSNWKNGIGSSLKAGVGYIVEKFPTVGAVILLVCDQPFLTSNHLTLLNEKFLSGKKSIIASQYTGVLGVPVLFSRDYFSELLNLKDDEGAKKLIHFFMSDVDSVNFSKGDIDFDTQEEYKKLNSH